MNGINDNESVQASQVWFPAPFAVEIRDTELTLQAPEQVLVRTRYSAISAGSELLVYRGQLPEAMALDSSLDSLQQHSNFPLQYGYACVGEVVKTGQGVDPALLGRQVFSFQPHASHFLARSDELIPIPDDISLLDAVFLPNMETAVNLVHDGRPLLGERVAVVGQGIVGLLSTAVLSRIHLAELVAVDTRPERLVLASKLGAAAGLSPDEASRRQDGRASAAMDLVFELSGQPEALNLAIGLCGFASRIVIGSWYGNKSTPVELGGEAHRNRLQILTSQVSTLAPEYSGRWDKQRRFELVWDMLRVLQPRELISHMEPLRNAESLYAQLDNAQPDLIQAVFDYSQ